MLAFILFLSPAAVATALADRLRRSHLSARGGLYLLAWNAVLVNAATWAAKKWILRTGPLPLPGGPATTADAALKYVVLATLAAVLAGVAEALLANRFRVEADPGADGA